ncbi:MAG: Rrf2 family transcriptional regulator [Anaerotignum sp.]|nr:Rrf2 family transcriptional regulator [Anaerotignum sp.]
MKISTRGRYGIRLMLALALNYEKGTIPLKAIAKDQGISEKYLEQIINPLTKAGLVKSFRGAQGDYTLTNSPDQTTVGEVLRVLEGSLSPVDCVDHPNCENYDRCVSLSIWKKMKEALDEVVDNITLADMAKEFAEKNPDGNFLSCND